MVSFNKKSISPMRTFLRLTMTIELPPFEQTFKTRQDKFKVQVAYCFLPTRDADQETFMRKVFIYSLRYWNGNITAGNAFLFGYFPLTVIATMLMGYILSMYSSGVFLKLMAIVAGLLLLVFTFIGMWRCAKYTRKSYSKYITRTIIVLYSGPLIITLLILIQVMQNLNSSRQIGFLVHAWVHTY